MIRLRRALVGAVGIVAVAAVLTGCDNSISAHYMSAAPGGTVARVWTAPHGGIVDISALVQSDKDAGATTVSITKNGTMIWGPETLQERSVRSDVSSLTVVAGDVVRFVAAAADDKLGGKIIWDPDVIYQ